MAECMVRRNILLFSLIDIDMGGWEGEGVRTSRKPSWHFNCDWLGCLITTIEKTNQWLCGLERTWFVYLFVVFCEFCCCFFNLRRRYTMPERNWHTKMKHHIIFGSFFGNQRFCEDSWSWCQCRGNISRVHSMAYDALTNGSMSLWYFNDFFYNHFWTSGQCEACPTITPNLKISLIWGQFQDSVRPASTNEA